MRAIPGAKCHEVLFGRQEICQGCPLDRAEASREPAPIHIGRRSIRDRVQLTLYALRLGIAGLDEHPG